MTLLKHRVRRLVEHEEFVLESGVGLEPHVLRALHRAPQHRARAQRLGLTGELAEEEQHVFLEGNLSARIRQHSHRRVRVAGVPAGEVDVVVELVVGIPAEHYVAETEAAVEGGEKFLPCHVFAAQNAVDVEHTHLDVRHLPLLDDGTGIRGGLYVRWLHQFPPRSGERDRLGSRARRHRPNRAMFPASPAEIKIHAGTRPRQDPPSEPAPRRREIPAAGCNRRTLFSFNKEKLGDLD